MKKSDHNLDDLWDSIKYTSIHIMVIAEMEKEK